MTVKAPAFKAVLSSITEAWLQHPDVFFADDFRLAKVEEPSPTIGMYVISAWKMEEQVADYLQNNLFLEWLKAHTAVPKR